MTTAIFIVRTIFLSSIILAAVAGLSELEVLGNGNTLGRNSLQVMLWAIAVTVFTSPILVSFVYPWQSAHRTSENEDVGP